VTAGQGWQAGRQAVASLGVGEKFVKLVGLSICVIVGGGGGGGREGVKMPQSCRTRVKEIAIKDTQNVR
jgi:hypothetical protein